MTTVSTPESAPFAGPIVFYDGECGACNWGVQYLLKRDAQGLMRFAALQGETAKERLPAALVADLDTMAYAEGGQLWTRSTALLRAVAATGGTAGFAAKLALLLPRVLRDVIYRLVARNRKRFGLEQFCRLLGSAEQVRFLP
ncbi:MAG: putative DCC family thiol-disulfide oxidoreductase YuxK [Planctomycetota bacterium]|jgi:predicted DCC family thiol-disulfide oxidoreductase YuxK